MKVLREVPEKLIPLSRSFFNRNAVVVAREVLGMILVRRIGNTVIAGEIIEAEAYRGRDDPASHAYKRRKGSEIMFGPPGHAYIYIAYGIHHLLNITAEPPGMPGGVLIRSIRVVSHPSESLVGRAVRGPARVTTLLKVDMKLFGIDMTKPGPLYVCKGSRVPDEYVGVSSRIGISKGVEKPWRFYDKRYFRK